MLQDFLTLNIFGFFMIFARVGAAFFLLPGFSASFISPRTRLLFALAVSFVLAPTVAAVLPGLPPSPLELFLALLGEIVVGAFLGAIGRILVGALQTAGTIIAFVSSMANAFVQDPIIDQQSSLVAGFLGTVGLVIIFVTDTHHLMLRAMADSYSMFPPAQPLAFGDLAEMIGRRVADSFRLGAKLASPFIVIGLTYNIGLGLLGRLMPNMPTFFVALPIQISAMMVALSGMMLVFLTQFQEGFTAFLVP